MFELNLVVIDPTGAEVEVSMDVFTSLPIFLDHLEPIYEDAFDFYNIETSYDMIEPIREYYAELPKKIKEDFVLREFHLRGSDNVKRRFTKTKPYERKPPKSKHSEKRIKFKGNAGSFYRHKNTCR
jgi:hypothetical protein